MDGCDWCRWVIFETAWDHLLLRGAGRAWTLGYVPLSQTGAELLFEVFSQRYERGSTIVTSNLPFDDWSGVFASERLTGALLDRLTHHVHILKMNGDSYRLKQSKRRDHGTRPADSPHNVTEG